MNQAIEQEISMLAQQQQYFNQYDHTNINRYYNHLFRIKSYIDSLLFEQSRQPRELSVLYKIFLLDASFIIDNVSPEIMSLHLREFNFLQSQVKDAQEKYRQIILGLVPVNKEYNQEYESGTQSVKHSEEERKLDYHLNMQRAISNSLEDQKLEADQEKQAQEFEKWHPFQDQERPSQNIEKRTTYEYDQGTTQEQIKTQNPQKETQPLLNPEEPQSDQQKQKSPYKGRYLTQLKKKRRHKFYAGLNCVICPLEILDKFVGLSMDNTEKGIETCGILAGIERNNTYIVNTLIIPQQQGHKDHCFMTDELGLFEAQIKNKVMTIGWIHTHPEYIQLPEAIALVYSPIDSHNRFKAFRIKDECITEIQECEKDWFHSHQIETGVEVYEECKHVQFDQSAFVNVKTIDLRNTTSSTGDNI